MKTADLTLVLIRHGNTFEAGEIPYMVGRNEDLPLTKDGEGQGIALGKLLKTRNLAPSFVWSSVLQRARKTAECALIGCGSKAEIKEHEALSELDYGLWSGLTSDQIRDRFGDEALSRWDREGIVPPNVGFAPSTEEIKRGLLSLLQCIQSESSGRRGVTWIVSSNGILRYFPKLECVLSDGRVAAGKMRTGAFSILRQSGGDAFQLVAWDERP